MNIVKWTSLNPLQQQAVLRRPSVAASADVNQVIKEIFDTVKTDGDMALYEFTRRYDGVDLKSLYVDIPNQVDGLDATDRKAMRQAADNINAFHTAQGYVSVDMETTDGVRCRRVVRPIGRAGLYVPAGSAPLFSTLLMIAIPARIAGVGELVVATPPSKDGSINPYILEAARLCGVKRLLTVGGAQAIAAMALGTKNVPKVDKIFGPGNVYVAAAKAYASSLPNGPAFDLPAGPSEVMVIADQWADPRSIAADLLAQAEHDPLAQVICLSLSKRVAEETLKEVNTQLSQLPRAVIAKAAMMESRMIVVDDKQMALAICNAYAPEHLILQLADGEDWLAGVETAGSVFIGPYTPEALGDYASGTNHVLPTAGAARAYGGVGVESFQRTMTVQTATLEGLQSLGPLVARLARAEGLEAHARSVDLRLEGIK